MEKNKVGLFGGTFDPIHFGHITLAVELSEKHQLDEVWLIPAFINPHKEGVEMASAADRLKMTDLVCQDIPGFSVIDIELQREGVSFSVDTIEALLAEYGQDNTFFLMLSEEAAAALPRWHRPDDIVKMTPLLVGRRGADADLSSVKENATLWEAVSQGMTPTSLVEISATNTRQRLTQGLYCGHLVPEKVLDYIQQHQLYSKT